MTSMANTISLAGPPFSISGDRIVTGREVDLQFSFNNEADQALVLAYEWYIDEELVADVNGPDLSVAFACGYYAVSGRILTAQGWSGTQGLFLETCSVPVSLVITGPDTVEEGQSADYLVIATYVDDSTRDLTSQYVFSCPDGVFTGNHFTADTNAVNHDTRQSTVTASKNGAAPLTRLITIIDTTPVTVVSLRISGPAVVEEGTSAVYEVIATMSDGTEQDRTADYTFSASEGTFTGHTYFIDANEVPDDTRQVTITASKPGSGDLTREITIDDTTQTPLAAGVLTVDLFSNTSLDVIGLIANAEVSLSHVPAYTGHNSIPVTSPEIALILASDLIAQPVLNWRFVFNVEKLVADYPAVTAFVFDIRGRGDAAGPVSGAFGTKSNGAVMTLSGEPGSYIPSSTGGVSTMPIVDFDSRIVAGANGDYTEGALPSIIELTYHVASRTVTYKTPDLVVINDFDFMTVSYNWNIDDGNDLDILVGYENNGTPVDNIYVGFGSPNPTVPPDTVPPADAYLWWGLDSHTSNTTEEGVLIGIRKFIAAFPASPAVVEIGLYAVWYGGPLTGNFTVTLRTYLGGVMSLDGTDFINTGGTLESANTFSLRTMISNHDHDPATAFKVGTLKYNKDTQSAVIQLG
jgi:hypothetical protein